ncbi:MAG: Calx-beta domain-containing protein [Pseudomonadota bacterium]
MTILDDTIVEDNEFFKLCLKKATGGATIGDPDTAVVTIVDDDTPPVEPGTLQFSSATYSVDENGGYVTITVSRLDGDEGTISVDSMPLS